MILSTGERERADIAWLLLRASAGSTVTVDEFTSFLDRQTARQLCLRLREWLSTSPTELSNSKNDDQVQGQGKRPTSAERPAPSCARFIVAGVHSDILPWLAPDWALHSKEGKVSVLDEDYRWNEQEQGAGVDTKEWSNDPADGDSSSSTADELVAALSADTTTMPSPAHVARPEQEGKRLLAPPPPLHLTVRRIANYQLGKQVWNDHFEEPTPPEEKEKMCPSQDFM